MIDKMLGLLDRLRGLGEKARDAELKNLTADLRLGIADLREEVAKLKAENTQLRGERDQLRERLRIRRAVEYRDGFYYLKKPKAGESQGPFCTTCFEEDHLLITLRDVRRERFSTGESRITGARCMRCARRFSSRS